MRKRVTRWKTVKVQRTRYVVVSVKIGSEPVYAICADWEDALFGAQTASHETMHLLGIRDEAVAECYGMQTLAYWVWKLSGDEAFAKEASLDYWTDYQANRPGTEYGHPGCYAGGPLDWIRVPLSGPRSRTRSRGFLELTQRGAETGRRP